MSLQTILIYITILFESFEVKTLNSQFIPGKMMSIGPPKKIERDLEHQFGFKDGG